MKYSNSIDFDYMDNYKALLACILSNVTADRAISYIAQQKIGRGLLSTGRPKGGNSKMEVYVIDNLENRVIRFESLKDAANELKLSRSTVSVSLNTCKLVKHRWIFSTKKPNKI